MTIGRLALVAAAAFAISPVESSAQPVSATPSPSYADLADLGVAAPLAIDARIRSAIRMPEATGVAAGRARHYVEADVLSLIRGSSGVPARIAYIYDAPLDARARAPKLKKQRVLLLARPVAGKPASIQLVAPDAQLAWSADADSRLRAILAEAVAPGAPPRITGVRGAFNVPGAVAGESETQIFLSTAQEQPVSISVIRRPGQAPRWAVALGEIVDESAGTPKPDTLLWYRLACGLPANLPATALAGMEPAQVAAARADYALVVNGLGACGRTRA